MAAAIAPKEDRMTLETGGGWKMMFLFNEVSFRFHLNIPGKGSH